MGAFEDLMEISDFSPVNDFYQEFYIDQGPGFLYDEYQDFLLHYRPGYYLYEDTTLFRFMLAVSCIKGFNMIKEYNQLESEDYNLFLVFACKGGSLDLVEYILSKFNYNPFNLAFAALKSGVKHMNIIEHMYPYTQIMSDDEYRSLIGFASFKNKKVVKYLLEKRPITPELDIYFPHSIFKFLLKLPDVDASEFLTLISENEDIDHLSQNYIYLEKFVEKYPNAETKTAKLKINKQIKHLIREFNEISPGLTANSNLNHIYTSMYKNNLKKLRAERDQLE